MKYTIDIKEIGLYAPGVMVVSFPARDTDKVKALVDGGKPLAAVIGEKGQKRSQSANAYAWALIDQLSETLGIPATDVYRSIVKELGGVSLDMQVLKEALPKLRETWEQKGIGWQVQEIERHLDMTGACVIRVRLWYGSSAYDAAQMHRFIDLIVQECQQQGIQTMTPGEIAKLEGLSDGK